MQQPLLDGALLEHPSIPELLREGLRRAVALAEQDISSHSASFLWPRHADPLSVCSPTGVCG
jgi:hypothetical protein